MQKMQSRNEKSWVNGIESVVARHDLNFPSAPVCISVGVFVCAK